MKRPTELDKLDPLEAAAAVSQFLEPAAHGDWAIQSFEVDKVRGTHDYIRSFGDGGGRFTPPGKYVMLTNINPDTEFTTMMSNTPDELTDHEDFMREAEGRVLVTGLGLSCIVSGLLANDYVEHIDVIEYSADVIALVGPSYEGDPRVTIHHADAAEWEIPENARWDYAWHDIWAFIADYNLDDETAENNISYRRLFDKYAPHVKFQAAWAFGLALAMRRCDEMAEAEEARWEKRWAEGDEDERVKIQREWMGQSNPVIAALNAMDGEDHDGSLSEEQIDALVQISGGEEALRTHAQADKMKFMVESNRYMGQAKFLIPVLMEAELESYGYEVVGSEFATRKEVIA